MPQATALIRKPSPAIDLDATETVRAPSLSRHEVARYCRHLVLPEIGFAGQRKLIDARVLCVGTGGLGSPMSLYLAAAGVGHLGIVDSDDVDASNLQRQVIHFTPDVGRRKVESAAAKLRALNPQVEVTCHDTMLTAENALDLCAQYDVIADATDNFATRYLTNAACVRLGKPNVYASIFRFEGQASVFDARKGPCYRCLYPEPPAPHEVPGGAELGILGAVPGLMGVIQATEVMKLILGIGTPLIGRLLTFDALEMRTHELAVRKDPDCPVCGKGAKIELDAAIPVAAAAAGPVSEIDPQAAYDLYRRDTRGTVFLDVRNDPEWAICRIEGAQHIPFDALHGRRGELNPLARTIVYCLTGARSRKATEELRTAGFADVRCLKGGLRAWAAAVDPAMWIY